MVRGRLVIIPVALAELFATWANGSLFNLIPLSLKRGASICCCSGNADGKAAKVSTVKRHAKHDFWRRISSQSFSSFPVSSLRAEEASFG